MFVAGQHDYGTIDQYEQTSVTTRFAHVWFVPLWPVRSIVRSSLRPPFVVPLVRRSVIAGYLRVWGPLVVALCVLQVIAGKASILVAAPLAGIAAVAGAFGWWMGRLGALASVERRAYRRAIDLPLDPSVLGIDDRRAAREVAAAKLEGKHADYRGMATVPLERLLADPTADMDALSCALTVARIDETFSTAEERAKLRSTRRRIAAALMPRF